MNATVLLITVFTFTAVVFGLGLRFRTRQLIHQQTLAAIEKGVDIPVPTSAPWTPRIYLLHGMVWLFAGLGSFIALSALAVTSRRPMTIEERLVAVNDARFRGATPDEAKMLLDAPREQVGLPLGFGFLGFIPIGVGLAYLIFYRVESKKLVS